MENLSLSIIDDRLYESILHNFWRVDSSTNISEKYAGSRKVFESTKNCYLMDHHKSVVKGGSVSQNAPFGTSFEKTTYFTEHGKLWYLIILIFLDVWWFLGFLLEDLIIVIIYWWWCWQEDSNSAWVSTYSILSEMPRKPSSLHANISKLPFSPPAMSTISKAISQLKASMRSHRSGRLTSEAIPLICRPIIISKECN